MSKSTFTFVCENRNKFIPKIFYVYYILIYGIIEFITKAFNPYEVDIWIWMHHKRLKRHKLHENNSLIYKQMIATNKNGRILYNSYKNYVSEKKKKMKL